MPEIIPVILCGGSGTRLWPLSRESHPKQFVELGNGRTLFGDALRRGASVPHAIEPILSTNADYRFFVRDELRKNSMKGKILLEPATRNTAPAIALAAFAALENDGDPFLLVLPSDHEIGDNAAFSETVSRALPIAEKGYILTFGIDPTYPATGFGYLLPGEPIGDNGFILRGFTEKPGMEEAARMLREGGHYWNSGMFLMRPSVYLRELKKWSPDVYDACRASWDARKSDKELIMPDYESFCQSPIISIDYAVMEKSDCAAMLPLGVEWNDLGSWDVFFKSFPRDSNGNACHGDAVLEDSKNCQIYGQKSVIAAVGVEDLTIVETGDAVLVARRGEAQRIRNVVNTLRKQDRYQYQRHTLVPKPWGSFETLAKGDRFQVKRLIVNPGESLSLQIHHHRAEHWVIVAGTARVTLDDESRLFTENQAAYIPVGCAHMLTNPGKIPLVIIEIQSGPYLGEDDIVRMKDIYGRE